MTATRSARLKSSRTLAIGNICGKLVDLYVGAYCRRSIADAISNTAELVHDRHLAGINTLDAVAHGSFDGSNILDQAPEALPFHGGGLVASPHCSIKSDVAFYHARSERGSRH